MKKKLLLALLILLAVVQLAVYWNAHLYHKAVDDANLPEDKIRLLHRANWFFPWNEQVFFELGRAYFELGDENLGTPGLRDASFSRSLENYMKAVRLNPGSLNIHFHFAQSLLYMEYLSLPTPLSYFEEYKKAALLTGHNTQVYFEVGKVLLSQWDSLTEDEKDLALDILGKMLATRSRDTFLATLEVWYLYVQDPAVIEGIIPEDVRVLSAYAQFLGERSILLDERQKTLARVENLEFDRARDRLEMGQRKFDYYQIDDAFGDITECVRALKAIRFYQDLTGEITIDTEEYGRIQRDARLLLAKIYIERTRDLEDPEGYIDAYLALENRVSAVGEFEIFLKDRGLLGEGMTGGTARQDFKSLTLQMVLGFKQNRYREITRIATDLERNILIVPEEDRDNYVRILQIIGDSHSKLDYLYETEKIYLRALDLDSENLDTLFRLERCYNRLNSREKANEVREIMARLLTPPEFRPDSVPIRKGESRPIDIFSDGRATVFRITCEPYNPSLTPLITVLFGGRVVREGFAEEGEISFSVTPAEGKNRITVIPLNGAVTVTQVILGPASSE